MKQKTLTVCRNGRELWVLLTKPYKKGSPREETTRLPNRPSPPQPLRRQNEIGPIRRKSGPTSLWQNRPKRSMFPRPPSPGPGSRAKRHRIAQELREAPTTPQVQAHLSRSNRAKRGLAQNPPRQLLRPAVQVRDTVTGPERLRPQDALPQGL